MYVVGSDRFTLSNGRLEPVAPLHAVDDGGRTLCRPRPSVYTFLAEPWEHRPGGVTCGDCHAAMPPARPAGPLAVPYAAPWADGVPVQEPAHEAALADRAAR